MENKQQLLCSELELLSFPVRGAAGWPSPVQLLDWTGPLRHLCLRSCVSVCACVCVPCVVAPAPGQSAGTAAAACGAGLSALLPPSWQMTSPGEANKLHGRTLNLLFLKFLHAVLLQDQLEYNTKTRSLYWYKPTLIFWSLTALSASKSLSRPADCLCSSWFWASSCLSVFLEVSILVRKSSLSLIIVSF